MSESQVALLQGVEGCVAPEVDAVVLSATELVAPALRTISQRPIVIDEGQGPGAAVHTAAGQLAADWLLVVGADHPRPSAALVRRLITTSVDCDADAVAVEDARLQPFWALYRRSVICTLERRGGLTHLLDRLQPIRLQSETLTPDERAAFFDVDTPEDARRFGIELEGEG